MQITSITLQNVRRFVDPVRIVGLGPGLNVLTAPNESGKSTFFDALHAVFFVSHRSRAEAVRNLIPHVGGDPEVTVEFQIDGAHWKLLKCWSSSDARKDAKLWRDGNLVAQKAEAEETLATLMKAPADGGPAGLLWVRQGPPNLEKGGVEQQARRDIMTSVAGEVEAMTGGRRMEAALAKCAAFLGQHLTSGGKPSKNGGLKAAQDAVDELTQTRDRLSAQVRALQDDLNRRRQLRRELLDLTSDAAGEERQTLLAKARAGYEAAQAHDQKMQVATGKVAELKAHAENGAAKITALQEALQESKTAVEKAEQAVLNVASLRDQAAEARTAFDAAKAAHVAAVASADKAAAQLRLALAAERAAAAGARRTELQDRIVRAEALRKRAETLEAEIALCLSADRLKGLETLASERDLAMRARDASAAAFSVSYAPGADGRVSRDGLPVAGGQRHAVPIGAVLDLDGIGRLEIHPADGQGDGAVARADAALVKALAVAGVADLDAARASDAKRSGLESALQETRADLKAAAPKGVAALRQDLANLPEPVHQDGDIPDVSEAEATDRAARQARDDLAEALEAARTLDQTRKEALTRAETLQQQAQERADRATRALAAHDDPAARLMALMAEATQRAAALTGAETVLDKLRRDAPDLAAAKAALTRAQSVLERDDQRIGQLREERAALDTRITVVSSAAVEEELALTLEQLQEAEARQHAIQFEIDVYQRLQAALTAAQDQSRERYTAAVHRELVPLLRMIWPDADPQIDAETGLITAITRRAVAEDFDILSGGTQEQISLLVRLAFARIIAADGRPAPVVLDDAIIYTDDDRIEQMFDALTRQSADLQIIVFSCRQRAFRTLGGRALTIQRTGDAA